jgi:hypothetical protein
MLASDPLPTGAKANLRKSDLSGWLALGIWHAA